MSFISAWATAILGVVVLSSMVEILMPEAETKKYVNFVLGLIIMIIFIRPIAKVRDIDVVNAEFDFNTAILHSSPEAEQEPVEQDKLIENIFAKKMSDAITRDLSAKYGEVEVIVDIYEARDEESYGQIERVTVYGGRQEEWQKIKRDIRQDYGIDDEKIEFWDY